MKIWFSNQIFVYLLTPRGSIGEFVSSVKHKQRFLTQTIAVCHSWRMRKQSKQWVTYSVTDRFRSFVYYARARWRITRRLLWTRSGQLDKFGGSEVNNFFKYCSVSCTERLFRILRPQYIVTSVYVLCVCFCFTLKAVGPIDWHYDWQTATGWVKNLRWCSTEETKSPTSWMTLG